MLNTQPKNALPGTGADLRIADMYALLLLVLLAAVAANSLLGWLIRHVTRYSQATERVFFT
jgi:hypothetical protein